MSVTAIYVHEPNTTLSIDAGGAPLVAKTGGVTPTDKPVTLGEGVYLIASTKRILVEGDGRGDRYDVHEPTARGRLLATATLSASKDDWPDPPKKFSAERDEIVAWLNAKGGDAF